MSKPTNNVIASVRVVVACEACGHRFDFDDHIFTDTDTRRLDDGGISPHRCPNCDWMQSWMVPKYKTNRGLKFALVFAVLGASSSATSHWKYPPSTASSSTDRWTDNYSIAAKLTTATSSPVLPLVSTS